jgi:DNA-3-methyladenine glycosylase I
MSNGERCWWCGEDPRYVAYHDHEWGFPVADDRRLFEKLVLEGFQSGLSWLTILRKRETFRRAFAGFEIEAVARFGEADVARLLGDAGIVRHRGKIEAALSQELKRAGFTFVGPTTVYAFMQAMGLVNDHVEGCPAGAAARQARAAFTPPG